jgi:hypothetical protein
MAFLFLFAFEQVQGFRFKGDLELFALVSDSSEWISLWKSHAQQVSPCSGKAFGALFGLKFGTPSEPPSLKVMLGSMLATCWHRYIYTHTTYIYIYIYIYCESNPRLDIQFGVSLNL